MALFREEKPTLSQSTLVADGPTSGGAVGVGQYGIEPGSKIVGAWVETFSFAAATATSQTIFTAMYPIELVGVQVQIDTASTSGTVTVNKCTGTQAPAAGTAVLTGTINIGAGGIVANTVTSGTLVSTNNTTTLRLAAGDRFAVIFGGTVTSLAGCVVSLQMKKL